MYASGNKERTVEPVFRQGEVTLDITEGKLFLLFELRERPSADQEIVHAQEDRDHFLENSFTSVASLRPLIGSTPEQ